MGTLSKRCDGQTDRLMDGRTEPYIKLLVATQNNFKHIFWKEVCINGFEFLYSLFLKSQMTNQQCFSINQSHGLESPWIQVFTCFNANHHTSYHMASSGCSQLPYNGVMMALIVIFFHGIAVFIEFIMQKRVFDLQMFWVIDCNQDYVTTWIYFHLPDRYQFFEETWENLFSLL